MRWPHFLIIQLLLVLAVGAVAYVHKDKIVVFKTPPESLAQWYKPENKRQVWLHTMFSLRREMQATKYYLETGDFERLNKWVTKLSEHYLKLADMVPEWSESIDRKAILSLQASSKNHQVDEATYMLNKISETCSSCHQDYRVITAMRYRAPDFSSISMNSLDTASSMSSSSTPLSAHMTELTEQVNQVKIFAEDGLPDQALSAYADLSQGLTKLGDICSDCHKDDSQVFPSDEIKQTMASLEQSLHGGTLKDQGRYLGTLAVQACATCHGTHRISFDMRDRIAGEQKWLELIKH